MPEIAHVVVLMLENRSFDHLLGFLDHPDPSFDGLLRGGPYTNPGWNGGPDVPAAAGAKRVIPAGPDHSHAAVMQQLALHGRGSKRRPTNAGFVQSYERKGRGLGPRSTGWLSRALDRLRGRPAPPVVTGRGPLIMQCQPPQNVPVLSRLALEFAVCTRWFSSVPGETWPNRNFLHAATSDGEVDINLRPYTDRTIFDVLEDHGHTWRIYHDDTPQAWAFPGLWDTPGRHARWHPFADFARHVAQGDLPTYAFIEPDHRPPIHTPDHWLDHAHRSDNQHPENNLVSDAAYDAARDITGTDFERGEALIATVYESLRARPDVFARTLLVVAYDEHGGFYDHVPPPTDVPAPGDPPARLVRLLRRLGLHRAPSFDFTLLGPRVAALVVSPHVPPGTVDPTVRDHASVPATLRELFAPAAAPLTRRDAWAPSFQGLLSLPEPRTDLPDLSAFVTPSSPPAAAAAVLSPSRPAEVPDYYRAFVTLSDNVERRLRSVGEPEAAAPMPGAPLARAERVTEVFQAAADRHRAMAGGSRGHEPCGGTP